MANALIYHHWIGSIRSDHKFSIYDCITVKPTVGNKCSNNFTMHCKMSSI